MGEESTDQFVFECDNGQRVSTRRLCDDRNDCGDNSDETIDCTVYDFQCEDGSFIDELFWCNGTADCPGGSDEMDCPRYVCADGEEPQGLFP